MNVQLKPQTIIRLHYTVLPTEKDNNLGTSLI